MPRVWFTADTHFGHANIIKHCSRPFESAAEMDAVLIANWNAVVRPNDTVFHLGDFAFRQDPRQTKKIFGALNGAKTLITGNHDDKDVLELGWAQVDKLLGVKVEGTLLVLCHYAMRTWPKSHHGAFHLYGHSHGQLPGTGLSCDVGVDCWDYRPVSLDEIRLRLAETADAEMDASSSPCP